jgi:septation ring formation regulator EzrA
MNSVVQELQAHYDEVQRQLQVTLDQYGIAQRKLQSITAELEEVRGNYEAVRYVFQLSDLNSPDLSTKAPQFLFIYLILSRRLKFYLYLCTMPWR